MAQGIPQGAVSGWFDRKLVQPIKNVVNQGRYLEMDPSFTRNQSLILSNKMAYII